MHISMSLTYEPSSEHPSPYTQELPSCVPLTISLPAAAGVTLPSLGTPANNPNIHLSIFASKGAVEGKPLLPTPPYFPDPAP